MSKGRYDTISSTSTLGGRCRASLSSLHSFDDMVTSGVLYKKRFSGIGETRSMTGGLEDIVHKTFKNEHEDVRSLHFTYSVSNGSRPPSRVPSFRIGRANGQDEIDACSTISDGVGTSF